MSKLEKRAGAALKAYWDEKDKDPQEQLGERHFVEALRTTRREAVEDCLEVLSLEFGCVSIEAATRVRKLLEDA